MLDTFDMKYDQEIAQYRSLFLDGKPNSTEKIKSEIQHSWLRCKKVGLTPALSQFEILDPREDQILENPLSLFLRSTILLKEVDSFHDLIAKYHGALFYTNEDNSVVFGQQGNKSLLKYFNSIGFKIGSCLLEENIGTTALAIPPSEYHDAWVIGAEHYLDLFTPFFTYAYFGNYFDGLKVNTIIFLPKECFTDLFIYYLREYNRNCKTIITSYQSSLEVQLTEVLFKQYEQNQELGIMMLDSFGKILSANQKLAEWFQFELEDIKERDCAEIFPELKKVLRSLQTGEVIRLEEVEMKNIPTNMQYMRVDVMPVFEEQKVIGLILSFLDKKRIRQTVNKLSNSQAYYTFDCILGKSNSLQEVKQKALNVANSKSPVVITGESGTGKELFAQAIHNASPIRNGPFVAINCASVPSELIPSELFGYVEGAFTGARKGGSMGKFEYAHKGTLFLDEIGELSMAAQSMLLRVLEDRKIVRIGSNIETPVDVRIIAATNRDLRKMVKENTFRLDLFYRIFVMNLHLPSLIDRLEDIPILVNFFIDSFNDSLNKNVKRIDRDALSYLINYRWPGNVRELRNIIECGMNNASGEVLTLADLPSLSENLWVDESGAKEQTINLEKDLIQKEKQKILSLMTAYNGNKTKVSKQMGVSRATLYKKLEEFNLL